MLTCVLTSFLFDNTALNTHSCLWDISMCNLQTQNEVKLKIQTPLIFKHMMTSTSNAFFFHYKYDY